MPGDSAALRTVVNALAARGDRGEVVPITVELSPGTGLAISTPRIAGNLRKSTIAATRTLGLTNSDAHIGFGTGQDAVTGASAGLAVAVALRLANEGLHAPHSIAFTGSVKDDGTVGRVALLEVKLEAAERAGITDVVVPAENALNATTGALRVHSVTCVADAMQAVRACTLDVTL